MFTDQASYVTTVLTLSYLELQVSTYLVHRSSFKARTLRNCGALLASSGHGCERRPGTGDEFLTTQKDTQAGPRAMCLSGTWYKALWAMASPRPDGF
jgi:hypothetical protein